MDVVTLEDSAPGTDEVSRICAIENVVIRNLEITQCYWRLAASMAERTGEYANWCSFATWASRQAGQTIRGEDMLDTLGRRLHGRVNPRHPIRSLWRWLLRKGVFEPRTTLGRIVRTIHTPFDAFERASESVARGNLKVFEEIGFEFARLLAECPKGTGVDAPEFESFISKLRPGDPPDGQRYLQRAFVRYLRLPSQREAAACAAQALLANLEIGFHEQTRLQPEICDAMDSGVATAADLRSRIFAVLAPHPWIRAVVARGPVWGLVVRAAQALHRYSRDVAREVITQSLMVIAMPGDMVLPLGRAFSADVPESLRQITDDELVRFLDRFEPAAGTDDCGATDWSNLDQRMHYIAHLFRAYHQRPELFSAPFTAAQIAQFRAGVVPDGGL